MSFVEYNEAEVRWSVDEVAQVGDIEGMRAKSTPAPILLLCSNRTYTLPNPDRPISSDSAHRACKAQNGSMSTARESRSTLWAA